MVTLILWVLLLVGIGSLVLWRTGRRHSARVNAYFFNAVKVYALLGQEDARIAALVAAKAATSAQRAAMLDYLNRRTSDFLLESESERPGANTLVVVERLLRLKEAIASESQSDTDVTQEKQWLNDHNQEYLQALDRADPTVFVRQHPDLFSNRTQGDTVVKT